MNRSRAADPERPAGEPGPRSVGHPTEQPAGGPVEDPAGSPPQSARVLSADELVRRFAAPRDHVLVFTNGVFDLLHAGHLRLLETARTFGDRLVVAVNSDRSARRLKGDRRPIVPEQERARLVAALRAVDAVTLFDDDTPRRLIEALVPDVLVKGADYTEAEVVGADTVRAAGGRVELVGLIAGRSTTELIRATGRVAQGVDSKVEPPSPR